MRDIDRRTVDEFGITAQQLMDGAGEAVFEAVKEMLPSGGRIAIFCGRGNNGGDGLAAGRIAARHGYEAKCWVFADSEQDLSENSLGQLQKARAASVPVHLAVDPPSLEGFDLLVDALLGVGARDAVRSPLREAIVAINGSGLPVVAVDVPSGLDADTGAELGASVRADRTVTFGLPKPFLFQGAGVDASGDWTVADIGFPQQLLDQPTEAALLTSDWVSARLPRRRRSSHKGDCGRVLIVAGSRNMPGAASLAARGALRSGAGLVTVASVPSVCEAIAAQIPEAILLHLPEDNGAIAEGAAGLVIQKAGDADAVVFGPGLSHEPHVLEFLSTVFEHLTKPAVLDADALNAVSLGVPLPHGPTVLTPHPGEIGRMLMSDRSAVSAGRFAAAQKAAEQFSQPILLKGAYSVVAAPARDGRPLMVNATGNPGMATGGMGDVLSGVVATLMAQGVPPADALCCAAHWHGLAGDECAREVGVGFSPSDLAERLPAARATIIATCAP